ncbi:hypothetical protein BST91_03980 [Nonlabens tegetincola]|uniref:O-antigen polymerase n=1 Tax=Nonlabens tegetincola TaxID=323273 RepID=UPI000A20B218|nr:O-antigen polymerase [Nonlabens tegetincola]ARN70865.1 hypothetical protein BST91_03980 [Nonlabens tegetincola]
MNWFDLIKYLFVFQTFALVLIERKRLTLNPAIIYLVFNGIVGIGCFKYFQEDVVADYKHAAIIGVSPLLIYIGYLLAISKANFSNSYYIFWNKPLIESSQKRKKRLLYLLIFSIAMSILYYQLVGYNLFLESLRGGANDFVQMRLDAYSGKNYYAPGIFNQFKNTIFPILFVYFAFLWRNRNFFWYYIVIVGLILVFSLIGTGQRTFLVTGILIIIAIITGLKSGKISKSIVFYSSIFIIVVFGFLSLQLNRVSDAGLTSTLEQLSHRIFDSNQLSAVVGFRYVEKQNIVLGNEWLESLIGLVPGIKGSDLSNRIFDQIFGGFRGTAPLSVWGSAYHNFGFMGSIFLCLLVGFLYTKVYLRFINGKKTIIRVTVYCSIFVYLFTWIAGAPSQLLINGLLGCGLLLLFQRKKESRVS